MAKTGLSTFSVYEVFRYFLPGVSAVLGMILLWPNGTLEKALQPTTLLTLGVMVSVIVGVLIHAIVGFVEREIGRSPMLVFKEKLSGEPPNRIIVRLSDEIHRWIPLLSVVGPPKSTRIVSTTVEEMLLDTFESVFEVDSQPFLYESYDEALVHDREDDSRWQLFAAVFVSNLKEMGRMFAKPFRSAIATMYSDDGPASSDDDVVGGLAGSDDQRSGESSDSDEGEDLVTLRSNAEWTTVYQLVREHVELNGPGRSRKFQAIYEFCRSMSLVLTLLGLLYLTVIPSMSGASAVLLGLLDPMPFSTVHVSLLLLLLASVFHQASRWYKYVYIDCLIADFVNLVESPSQKEAEFVQESPV